MTRGRGIALAVACVAIAAILGSRCAEPATLVTVDAVMAMKVVGFTAAIVVQISRDAAVLFAVAVIGAALAYVHRMSILGFVALAAVLLAIAEPFATRADTVAAAWQSFRIVGRLSAATFALTFASYLDTLAEKPRGHLRALLRFVLTMIAVLVGQALSAIVPQRARRAVLAGVARASGLTIVLDDAGAAEDWHAAAGFSVQARTVFERLAAATLLVEPPPLRQLLREGTLTVGSEPKTTLIVRREITKNLAFDAFMPARFEIEPQQKLAPVSPSQAPAPPSHDDPPES